MELGLDFMVGEFFLLKHPFVFIPISAKLLNDIEDLVERYVVVN